jgi:dihydropteroate synthase
MTVKPLIMGILNVTPDSFSDGGLYLSVEKALRRAEVLTNEGADIIDIGGESTRPGSIEVSAEEEISRVIPVICALRANFPVRLSIDTRKAKVAEEALKHGATLVNDISGGRDPLMISLIKSSGSEIILMHMQGTPSDMQKNPTYSEGVVTEVRNYLKSRVQAFVDAGVKPNQLWVDPGIGFGKTISDNLLLLRELKQFVGIGNQLVIGTSRKSFLAQIENNPSLPFEDRLAGTLATNLWAFRQGATVFRVHDVGEFKRALRTWNAIQHYDAKNKNSYQLGL